jgi:hypothetical protein
VKPGRGGGRAAGALNLGALKLERAGMGRPASDPDSYEEEEIDSDLGRLAAAVGCAEAAGGAVEGLPK